MVPQTETCRLHESNLSRKTFLRHHVSHMLREGGEVMALGALRSRIKEAWKNHHQGHPATAEEQARFEEICARWISEEEFFDGLSEFGLYQPLRVTPLTEDLKGHNKLKNIADLTDLLVRLKYALGHGLRPGVVLVTRSGAGKTTASKKAFRDCVVGVPEADGKVKPPLGMYVPCWVPLNDSLLQFDDVRDAAKKSDEKLAKALQAIGPDLVEDLVRRAATPWSVPVSKIREATPGFETWMEVGPPLIVFIDLNAFGPLERRAVATSLVRYQTKYPTHRCVVCYRSVSEQDHTRVILLGASESGEKPFGLYDLETVHPKGAEHYLRGFRKLEAHVLEQLELPVPDDRDRRDDEACAHLRDLIRRFVRSGDREESLISTPLLMHFVSVLDDDQLIAIRTITDLYFRVVEQHLGREISHRGKHHVSLTDDDIQVALTRLALVMIGRDTKVISAADFRAVLERPRDHKHEPWWPTDRFWIGTKHRDENGTMQVDRYPYFARLFTPSQVGALREFSLIRADGAGVRFLHDSLIDCYAGAMALRHYQRPRSFPTDLLLSPRDATRIRDRIFSQPLAWRDACEFLGGSLGAEPFGELAREILATKEIPQNGPDLMLRLARGASGLSELASELHRVLVNRMTRIRPYPRDLASHVYGVLNDSQVAPAVALASRLKDRLLREKRCWLRLEWGDSPPREMILTGHELGVTAVAVLPDDLVVTGSYDKTVCIWDPRTGAVSLLGQHDDSVLAVAALADGRVVSGSSDKTVRIWDPRTGAMSLLGRHNQGVCAVAALSDGRVVTASNDGTLRIWDPRTGTESLLCGEDGGVRALAALSDGRFVSGSWDKTVRIWDPQTNTSLVLGQHDGPVTAIAVQTDKRVVSGSDDCTVRIWDTHTGDSNILWRNDGWNGRVSSVAALGDDRIISGTSDRTVRVWDAYTGELTVIGRHDRSVTAVAVLEDSRVVSGSDDQTVRIWASHSSEVTKTCRHDGELRALAGIFDGRIVSGSSDCTIRIWDLRRDQSEILGRHDDSVNAVAMLPNGRIISGSSDCTLRMWDLETGESEILGRHDDPVRTIAVLGDGRVVSGSSDTSVKIWDPRDRRSGRHLTLGWHGQEVWAVAVLANGWIVSGSSDNTIMAWDPNTGKSRILGQHKDTVYSIAVMLDGSVVSGSIDCNVRITNPHSDLTTILGCHDEPVRAVAALPDGRIISGSDDRTLRVWDAADDGRSHLFGYSLTASVLSLTVLNHGKMVAAGLSDGRIVSWAIEPGASYQDGENDGADRG